MEQCDNYVLNENQKLTVSFDQKALSTLCSCSSRSNLRAYIHTNTHARAHIRAYTKGRHLPKERDGDKVGVRCKTTVSPYACSAG